MADTLDRLMEWHGPRAKAIVWEHNTHVGDARATPMADAITAPAVDWPLLPTISPATAGPSAAEDDGVQRDRAAKAAAWNQVGNQSLLDRKVEH